MGDEEWKQCIASYLIEAARERNWNLEDLSEQQRRELLRDLRQRQPAGRNQAKFLIAKLLKVSDNLVEKDLR